MEFNYVAVVFIGFFLVLWSPAIMGFRMEISPSSYTEDSAGPVNIACIVEAADECVNKGVLRLELRKGERELVASVNQRDGFRYDTDSPKKYQGQGSVENHHNNRSFLNVSILAPDNEDSGLYTCSMLYFNENGVDKKDHASKNLTVEIFNVHRMLTTVMKAVRLLENKVKEKDSALQTAVRDLTEMHHIHSQQMAQKDDALQTAVEELTEMHHNHSKLMMAELAKKDDALQKAVMELAEMHSNRSQQMMYELARKDSLDAVVEKVISLQNQARNQTDEINDCAEKVAYISAFSAGLTSNQVTVNGKIIVFPDVIMSEGPGYDKTTGIFTAPREGLYAFHVVLRTENDCCDGWFFLKANDDIVASMDISVHSGFKSQQSSISTVVHLKVGDNVKVYVKDDIQLADSTYYNTFTGYMIKAL